MNLIRCAKGHYYDQDKNGSNCPYCAQAAAACPPSAPQASRPAPASTTPSSQAGNPRHFTADPQDALASSPDSSAAKPSRSRPASSAVPPKNTPFPAYQTVHTNAAPAPSAQEEDDNCTVGYYSRVIGVEPVVGWLVCIEGEYKGESFKLKSGRNFIGRAANMDVVLSADHSISRYKHAAVIYEPRSRRFIVATGESRELCYLNGEVVLSNQPMEAYDILDLGDTRLMLVPCCNKRFSWENGLEKDENGDKK
ncbi:MAG: FHA domain-containing protein [Clostridiales bacterium]|nr:FHA domain-containing protein [Clostridiales bacterium]